MDNTESAMEDGREQTAQLKLLCSTDLEDLAMTNHAEWSAALHDACIIADVDWILQGSPPPAITDQRHQIKLVAAVRALIRKTVPETLRVELPVGCLAQTPQKILSDIADIFLDSSEAVHRRLEIEASAIVLKAGHTIGEYLTKHKELRRRMHQASFPNITDEITSVRFAVNGLSSHPRYQEAARAIRLTGLPSTMRTLEERLLEDEAAHQNSTNLAKGINQFDGYSGNGGAASHRGRQSHRGRGRGMSLRAQLRKEITDTLRTEIKENIKSAKKGRQVHKAQANAAHAKHEKQEGTFILDTAAVPTMLTQAPERTTPLTKPTIVETANGSIQVNHRHPVAVKMETGLTVESQAFVLPSLKHNLLSMAEVIGQHGPVLLTKEGAYLLPTRMVNIIKLPKPFAICKNNIYVTCGSAVASKHVTSNNKLPTRSTISHTQVHAHSARTVPTKVDIFKRDQGISRSGGAQKTLRTSGTATRGLLIRGKAQQVFNSNHPTPDPTPAVTDRIRRFYHWHLIMNHAHAESIRNTLKYHGHPDANALKTTKLSCSACKIGKMQRAPHRRVDRHVDVGKIMCTDVAGPLYPTGDNGERYIITFTDVGSRFTFVIPLTSRAYVTQAIIAALVYTKHNTGQVPSIIYSDNAKEYLSAASIDAARSMGTATRTTIPYNPEENGIAERINKTLLEGMRTVLATAGIDQPYWPHAVTDVAFKHGLTLHATTGKVPFHEWTGTVQSLPPLFVFGQLGRIPQQPPGTKLQSRSIVARYMSYHSRKHITVQLQTGDCRKIRAVDFHPIYHNADPTVNHALSFLTFADKLKAIPRVVQPGAVPPINLSHAKRYPDSMQWRDTYEEAIMKLQQEKVVDWTTPAPASVRPLPLTVSFQYKWDKSGALAKRKARVSLRGDLMKDGIHFHSSDVQCPTAEKSTARILLAIAAAHSWIVEHLDIVNAFVHEPSVSPLPIYVKALTPWDRGDTSNKQRTGLLKRNLWGGRSAGNHYICALFRHLTQYGYEQSDTDCCMFSKISAGGTIAMAITVDDFLVVASTKELVDTFYTQMSTKYSLKRLGKPRDYLGWNIEFADDGAITISQPALAKVTIENANMAFCNGCKTPYINTTELHSPTADDIHMPASIDNYRQIVGDLRYLADSTRPDLTYITAKLGGGLQAPTERHWEALKRVIRYLKQSQKTGLRYAAGQKRRPCFALLQCYTDSNFAGDSMDRKSTSGGVITYNGAAVSWSSRKQSIVAMSTAEAEYVALASAVTNISAMRRLLLNAGLMSRGAIAVKTDNTATCDMVAKPHGTKRRKFIDLRHHFIQKQIRDCTLHVQHVSTKEQKADLFTKPLLRVQFNRQCQNIGIVQDM